MLSDSGGDKMHAHIFVVFIIFIYVNGQDAQVRQIVTKLNPDCERCNESKRPLIYVRAEGPTDTVHQLWDFTDHVPAVIFAIGAQNSTLKIFWTSVTPDKFQFDPEPRYTFAAAIDSIVEYNDIKDNGAFDFQSEKKTWPLDYLSWRLTDHVFTKDQAMVKLQGQEGDKEGLLEMKLDFLPFQSCAADLPHLIHTANSTLIDVRLINQTESNQFNSSRFAIHFVLVSSDKVSESWNLAMKKSLDDEHTPTVFEIMEIKSPRTNQSGDGGFMQYRPVAYTERERDVSSSTNVYTSSFNRTGLPRHSILNSFYGNPGPDALLIQDMVVSFGQPGDGFYKKHNYTDWSFTIGYGVPPVETVTSTVLLIISIIVGVAVLLLLAAGGFLLLRCYRQRKPSFRFSNDLGHGN